MSIKAVVVEADGTMTIRRLNGYVDFRNILLDSDLESLAVADDAVCYVDEEGKFKSLPANPVATAIVKTMLEKVGRMMVEGDYISGTAIFVGYDQSGDDCSLSFGIIEEYFSTAKTIG